MRARGIVNGRSAKASEPDRGALHALALGHGHKAAGAGRVTAELVREAEFGHMPGEALAIT